MKHYQFSNVEINDQFISANIYKNNNYTFRIEAEILHLEHNQDIEDTLYNEFREFALDYLYDDGFVQVVPANIINICQYIEKDTNIYFTYP